MAKVSPCFSVRRLEAESDTTPGTKTGEVASGSISAASASEVALRIEYLGLIPIETIRDDDAGAHSRWTLELTAAPRFEDVTFFTGDLAFLGTILSGEVGQTRVGEYLQSLTSRFPGPVVADMLCLIRINLELSLRGKGILIAREAGLALPIGEDVRANLEELKYLEKAIGRTGLLAVRPLLKASRHDLWHLYMLEEAGSSAERRSPSAP